MVEFGVMQAVHRSLVWIVLFASLRVLALGQTSTAPLQQLNIQISDASNHPMVGLQITTKCPGNLAKTDNAGKATLTFTPTGGAIELVIVAPKGLDFISPWGRAVTLPPEFWPITVAPHGQREMLEHPRVVRSLATTIDKMQARTNSADPTPSPEIREQVVSKVAGELGLSATDLRRSIQEWGAKATDPYSAGLFSLYNLSHQKAARLFSDTLTSLKGSASSQDTQTAADAAFLLGASAFETGDYKKSVDAYSQAVKFRPGDQLFRKGAEYSYQVLAEKQPGDLNKLEFDAHQQVIIPSTDYRQTGAHEDAQTTIERLQTVEAVVGNIDEYKLAAETRIQFKFGGIKLTKNAKTSLDQLVESVKGQHGYIFQVSGPSVANSESGTAMSNQMTDSVVRYLVLSHDIPVYRIYVVGASEAADPAGRSKQRLVDVKLLKANNKQDDLPVSDR